MEMYQRVPDGGGQSKADFDAARSAVGWKITLGLVLIVLTFLVTLGALGLGIANIVETSQIESFFGIAAISKADIQNLVSKIAAVQASVNGLASAPAPTSASADFNFGGPTVQCKRLIVGSGMGGQYSAYRLSAEFPGDSNVCVVTADDGSSEHLCGNIVDFDLVGSTPNKPWRVGGCAMRVNIATMPHMRCLANELNIPMYFSPWITNTYVNGWNSSNWRAGYGPLYPNDTTVWDSTQNLGDFTGVESTVFPRVAWARTMYPLTIRR